MNDMKEWLENNITTIIIVIAFMVVIVGSIMAGMNDINTWNNGYCECDGKWQYVESVTHTSRSKENTTTTVTYIYQCDRCGKMHEFLVLR